MKIKIPTTCPCCDYTLELVNDQLFCRNQACSAQLGKKLEHFCKTLGIKGMGAKTLEKLQLTDVTEIYYLELDQIIESLGSEKIAVKLLDEIDKSRNSDLATILPAFSIPLVGNTAAQKLAKVVNNIDEITPEQCKQAGLGEKVTNNLISWLETDFQEMREFLPFSFTADNKPVANVIGKTVCITGKLTSFKTKAEATKALENMGFKVTESVTKQTNYLVDEDNKGSSKRTKADQLGITIIENLSQFLQEKTYD
jgi:NAD-dependent DNA ligase